MNNRMGTTRCPKANTLSHKGLVKGLYVPRSGEFSIYTFENPNKASPDHHPPSLCRLPVGSWSTHGFWAEPYPFITLWRAVLALSVSTGAPPMGEGLDGLFYKDDDPVYPVQLL